jgi:hypothetical protein
VADPRVKVKPTIVSDMFGFTRNSRLLSVPLRVIWRPEPLSVVSAEITLGVVMGMVPLSVKVTSPPPWRAASKLASLAESTRPPPELLQGTSQAASTTPSRRAA